MAKCSFRKVNSKVSFRIFKFLPEALPFIEGYGRFTDQIPQPFVKEPFVNKALFFGAVHFSLHGYSSFYIPRFSLNERI